MDLDLLVRIKRLTIAAVFSDELLMRVLVLKGGNVIELVDQITNRASFDIDFAMETDFSEKEFASLSDRLLKALQKTFEPEGYYAFDVTVEPKPRKDIPEETWGGYEIT